MLIFQHSIQYFCPGNVCFCPPCATRSIVSPLSASSSTFATYVRHVQRHNERFKPSLRDRSGVQIVRGDVMAFSAVPILTHSSPSAVSNPLFYLYIYTALGECLYLIIMIRQTDFRSLGRCSSRRCGQRRGVMERLQSMHVSRTRTRQSDILQDYPRQATSNRHER